MSTEDWDRVEDALVEAEKAVERLREAVREGQRRNRPRVNVTTQDGRVVRQFEAKTGGQITP